MRDKHFVTALALLVLPLSFGGDLSAGSKATAEMDAANTNSRIAATHWIHATHGFTAAQMAALLAGSPIGFDNLGQTRELFVSSFDVTKSRDIPCAPVASETGRREFNSLDADCFAVTGGSANLKSSVAGFPMYDSFSGTDTAQHLGIAGSGPFGVGAGGSGGTGGGNGPIGPGLINPNVPISTPEPGTLLLLAGGLVMLGMIARRRMRSEAISF